MSTDDAGDDQEVRGLAGERTDLAWSRSGLAVFVCVAAVMRRALPDFETLDAREILIAALTIGGIAWVFGLLWARAVAAASLTGRRIGDPRTLRFVAFSTAALGAVATIIAIFPQR